MIITEGCGDQSVMMLSAAVHVSMTNQLALFRHVVGSVTTHVGSAFLFEANGDAIEWTMVIQYYLGEGDVIHERFILN